MKRTFHVPQVTIRPKRIAAAVIGFFVILIGLLVWWLNTHTVAILQPRGVIASQERSLIYFALLLSILVVVPVFALTIGIVLKYRESNLKPKKYEPEWDGSWRLESAWWGIPGVIIIILSVITWQSSHSLDPFRKVAADTPPLNVQVVSLDWKWLFIYPEQKIATVNYLPLPVDRPVNFELTSATVMNSFWIPQLGSQIYTMPGMSTKLHLMADQTGNYYGSSANISGAGFADMHFYANVKSGADFQAWVKQSQAKAANYDAAASTALFQKASVKKPQIYRNVPANTYNDLAMSFMMPMSGSHAHDSMEGMHHE